MLDGANRFRRVVRRSLAAACCGALVAATVGVRAEAATPTDLSTATHAAGYTSQWSYGFPGTALGPQWGVYDSPGTASSDSRLPEYVAVSGGLLHLTATGRDGSGVCLCVGSGSPRRPYGRWDVYAAVPRDPNHNFGILLWPNANQPKAGEEIDIAEFPGPDKTVLQNTVHLGPGNNKHSHFTNGDFTGFHKYSVLWTSSSLSFWVDDVLVWDTPPGWSPIDTMHLVVQAGMYSPNAPTDGSSTMTVKAVRYFH